MGNSDYHELLQSALQEIKRLRQEREAQVDRGPSPPIAILSTACRFPRAESPEEFWQVLSRGVDCVQEIPYERWDAAAFFDPDPDKPGKMVTRQAALLSNIRGFDAAFFGISPREARSMDPQQRLLLEVTWEALERAAIAADHLYEARVGVFLGMANVEYSSLMRQAGDPQLINSYFGTGNAPSVAAGRLAYFYGFHGPALIVDTACSSSLVALHLAVQSLRLQECDLAMAGGVNVLLTPETSVHFSNARMLSPDGRCKAFASTADGYGRGEGCGVVVLKRLSDALRDGDPICAVIRGSAVNHDGRSAGLTAPNGPAQEAVMQAALRDAGLPASAIQLLEAHGTGTPLGDPIEAGAVARVYGATRTPANPLPITSVKTNIGHTEAAAGIAGVIKACMCLEHRQLVPHLHFASKSSYIPWDSIYFPTELAELPTLDDPACAAVSSFGFSGTNAHVILQARDAIPDIAIQDDELDTAPQVLVLSAKTEQALRDLTARYADWLRTDKSCSWADVCYTLQAGRVHFPHRLAACANTKAEASDLLEQYLSTGADPHVWSGSPKTAVRVCAHEESMDWDRLSASELAQAYTTGQVSDWSGLKRHDQQRRRCLPTYAFQREDFWFKDGQPPPRPEQSATPDSLPCIDYWSLQEPQWRGLIEHTVFGMPVMPAVGWLHLAAQSAQRKFDGVQFALCEIEFLKLLPLDVLDSRSIAVAISAETDDEYVLTMQALATPDSPCDPSDLNVRARSRRRQNPTWMGGDLQVHQQRKGAAVEPQLLYEQLESLGFAYGPTFRGLQQLWIEGLEALGELQTLAGPSESRWMGLMDSGLHIIAGIVSEGRYTAQDASAFLPVSVRDVQWFGEMEPPAWSRAVLRPSTTPYALEADVFMWTANGTPLIQLLGLRLEGFLATVDRTPSTNESDIPRQATATDSETQLNLQQLLSLGPIDRQQKLQRHLHEQLAAELDIDVDALQPEQPLVELGLDSLMVFRMASKLEAALGLTMDMRNLLQGPSVVDLTKSVLTQISGDAVDSEPDEITS